MRKITKSHILITRDTLVKGKPLLKKQCLKVGTQIDKNSALRLCQLNKAIQTDAPEEVDLSDVEGTDPLTPSE